MCTVTWLHEHGGFHLFSSRDEKHSRRPAEPPGIFETRGVRWIAPIDPDQGGSWISANEFGLALCLLNGNGGHGRISRGHLIRELAVASDQREIAARLEKTDLSAYAPFALAILERGASAMLFDWNGCALASLANADGQLPLASSSVDASAARRARAELFETLQPRPVADLVNFHSSHLPEPGPLSPCMHRAEASTVSFTHVHVAAQCVRMTYYPGPLCRSPEPWTVQLHAPHCSDRPIHAGQ